MEEEKLYGCSIAKEIINKNQNRGNLGTSFSGRFVSINDLKECIKCGYAFSYPSLIVEGRFATTQYLGK